MVAGIIIGSIALFLLILFFVGLLGIYLYSFYSPHKIQFDDYANLNYPSFLPYKDKVEKMINDFKEMPYEDLYIESFDKLKLHARYYEVKGSKKIAIMFHGYRGTVTRDFCAGAPTIMSLGYSVITVDHRAHGESQGHSITFGVREVKDAVKWFEFIKNKFGSDYQYALIGISMGGATVLSASDKVGDNVKIIADCPYATPKAILSETLKNIKLSPKFFYPLVNLSSIIFGHTNLNKLSAYDSVKNTNNKILIIHGDSDTIVPHHNSYDLYMAYQDKIQYELFPGADHGVSYMTDEPRYKKVVSDFLNN